MLEINSGGITVGTGVGGRAVAQEGDISIGGVLVNVECLAVGVSAENGCAVHDPVTTKIPQIAKRITKCFMKNPFHRSFLVSGPTVGFRRSAQRATRAERSRLQAGLGGNLALLVESVREVAGITFRQQAVNSKNARKCTCLAPQVAEILLVPAIDGRIDR